MSVGLLLWIAGSSALIATVLAIATRVLRDFSSHELEAYCRKYDREDLLDEIIGSHSQIALAAESFQMMAVASALVSGTLLIFEIRSESLISANTLLSAILIAGVWLIVANSWLPGAVARFYSAPFLFHTWRIWRTVNKLAWPILVAFRVTAGFVRRLVGLEKKNEDEEEEALEEEIRTIVTAGERSGLIEQDAADMIEGVIELDDTTVAQIMTPKGKVDFLDVELSWTEMLKYVTEVRRSRIPVYEQRRDNVIGILVVKDLLPQLSKLDVDSPRSFRRFLREVEFVPGTNTVDEVLQHFLGTRNHIAVVVDEFQNVMGIVTIEDALEEIVGEIVDESDVASKREIEMINAYSANVLASTRIDSINEKLGFELPASDHYDTIGGMLMFHLHDIPKEDDTLELHGIKIRITRASRRGVQELQLHQIDSARIQG